MLLAAEIVSKSPKLRSALLAHSTSGGWIKAFIRSQQTNLMVVDVALQPESGSGDEGAELFHRDAADAASPPSGSLVVALSQPTAAYALILVASIALFLQSPHFRKSIGCSADLAEDALLALQRRLAAGASDKSVHAAHRDESLRASVHRRLSDASSGSATSSAASISSSLTATSSVQSPSAAHAAAAERLEALLSQWLVQMDFLALNRSLSARAASTWPRDLLRFLDALPLGVAIAAASTAAATAAAATVDDDAAALCGMTIAFCNELATDYADACVAHWLATERSSSRSRSASSRSPGRSPRPLGDALAVFGPLPPLPSSSQRDRSRLDSEASSPTATATAAPPPPPLAQLRRLVARGEAGAVVLATAAASLLWVVRPIAAASSGAQGTTPSRSSHVLLLQLQLAPAAAVAVAEAIDRDRSRVRLAVRDAALCDDLLALQDLANLLPALCAL